MNKRGYTIMEAVIAMLLIAIMVGAVFSTLMASRRAIIDNTDKEDAFFTLQSAYSMLTSCINDTDCVLFNADGQGTHCGRELKVGNDKVDLTECSALFTNNFSDICQDQNGTDDKFNYRVEEKTIPIQYTNLPLGMTLSSGQTLVLNLQQLNLELSCPAPTKGGE